MGVRRMDMSKLDPPGYEAWRVRRTLMSGQIWGSTRESIDQGIEKAAE